MSRKPAVDAPQGLKGCPKCKKIFDPIEYGRGAYCLSCMQAYERERYAQRQLRKEGMTAAEAKAAVKENPKELVRHPTGVGQLRHALKEQKLVLPPKIPPFPIVPRPHPDCVCCWGHTGGLFMVGNMKFCQRCTYYVSQCGRCLAHARREYIPALLHKPDPPLLPGDLGYDMSPLREGERDAYDED